MLNKYSKYYVLGNACIFIGVLNRSIDCNFGYSDHVWPVCIVDEYVCSCWNCFYMFVVQLQFSSADLQ
jgi:hypothetical protein